MTAQEISNNLALTLFEITEGELMVYANASSSPGITILLG